MCQVIIKSSGKTHPWASEIQTLFTSVQRTESHSGSWVFVLVWFFVRPALHFAQLLLFCDLHSNSALLCNVLCAIFSALWIKKKKKKECSWKFLSNLIYICMEIRFSSQLLSSGQAATAFLSAVKVLCYCNPAPELPKKKENQSKQQSQNQLAAWQNRFSVTKMNKHGILGVKESSANDLN